MLPAALISREQSSRRNPGAFVDLQARSCVKQINEEVLSLLMFNVAVGQE